MIIDRADLFGLAQLYQLRGRVGRSKERAYCYLVVPPANAMTDEARARIEALERHTELGSGFQIASLDLELRGAGDLLGGEQSGSVASVGFDMFCRMLDEAVHEMRGEEVVHDVDPELSLRRRGAAARGLRDRRRRAPVALQAPRERRGRGARRRRSRPRWRTASGAPPEEARRLVKLMALKTELRRLRALGCEANARLVTLAPARRHAARSREDHRAHPQVARRLEAHPRHAPVTPLHDRRRRHRERRDCAGRARRARARLTPLASRRLAGGWEGGKNDWLGQSSSPPSRPPARGDGASSRVEVESSAPRGRRGGRARIR